MAWPRWVAWLVAGLPLVVSIVVSFADPIGATESRKSKPYKSPDNDLEVLKKAAAKGDAQAQNSLGLIFGNGTGVPQDDGEAVKWFKMAAEQGLARAQNNLGNMYSDGRGVPQDLAEAARWYRKAAKQGDTVAQYNLAVSCEGEEGVDQNYREAIKWYRKAANRGLAAAQYNLGLMYDNGKGVPQDYVEAHKWFNLASTSATAEGNQDIRQLAAETRDGVALRMSYAQIAEAQKRASAWKPTGQNKEKFTPDLVPRKRRVLPP